MCQTLAYHKAKTNVETGPGHSTPQERLFWTVYKLERSLALRLGRSSMIRDEEITLTVQAEEPVAIRLARIQGQTYEHLYSPQGLSQSNEQRQKSSQLLAVQARSLIQQTQQEIQVRMRLQMAKRTRI